jgi:hypothetical protein
MTGNDQVGPAFDADVRRMPVTLEAGPEAHLPAHA